MIFCDMIAIKKRGSYEKKNSINNKRIKNSNYTANYINLFDLQIFVCTTFI